MNEAIKANPAPFLSDKADLRLISFNLRYGGSGDTSMETRAPLLCAQTLAYSADSIGFQEATPEWMEKLKSALNDKYDFVGVARDDGDNRGEYNPVFYLREKFDLIDSGTIWLSAHPNKAGSKFLTSCCIRICTWATLKDKKSGKVFTHLNTHLDHVSEKARLKQVDVLKKKIAEVQTNGAIVCTGDFNVYEDSDVYRAMCESFTDCKYASPVTERCGTFHDYNDENIEAESPIDFVFVDNGFEPCVYHVIRDKLLGLYLSDHYGLSVDLAVK